MLLDGGQSLDDIVESIASGIQSGRGLSNPGVLPALIRPTAPALGKGHLVERT